MGIKYPVKLSLNKIIRPESSVTKFIGFASECGISAIELRNDLPDRRVLGAEIPDQVREACLETGIEILTINALQRFNDPELFGDKKKELKKLVMTAKSIDCSMIILCPVNDPADTRESAHQHKDLIAALKEYASIFSDNGITGLIEPLGFPICSVRTKAAAVAAIQETGLSSVYKITHDTFHHYLSGETEFFPEETGLIHISGVLPGKQKSSITDEDRIFVTDEDCMDNIMQVNALFEAGYKGPVSYETFSPDIQCMNKTELKNELKDSIELIFS